MPRSVMLLFEPIATYRNWPSALAASAFATPAIIGGRRLKVASTLAYDEFLNTLNWPLGAAVAVLLLVVLVLIVVGASRLVERRYAQVFG